MTFFEKYLLNRNCYDPPQRRLLELSFVLLKQQKKFLSGEEVKTIYGRFVDLILQLHIYTVYHIVKD